MQPYREQLERYDALWRQAEALVETCLRRQAEAAEADAPSIRDLNTVILMLKRIQEARRAIHLDAAKLEAAPQHDQPRHAMDHEEISRILQLLEGNGDARDDQPADEEAV